MIIRLPESNLAVNYPPIEHFTNKILNRDFVRFVKLNHAYWQVQNKTEPWYSIAMNYHNSSSFMSEVAEIVNEKLPDDFLLGIGITPAENPSRLALIIQNTFPQSRQFYVGNMWKRYTVDQQIFKFIKTIRTLPITVIGFKHLEMIKQSWRIKDFNFVELRMVDSIQNRAEILCQLQRLGNSPQDKLFLFQGGEYFSLWLIYHLRHLPRTHLIDMGRALDIWTNYAVDGEQRQILDATIPDWKCQKWDQEISKENIVKALRTFLSSQISLL